MPKAGGMPGVAAAWGGALLITVTILVFNIGARYLASRSSFEK